MHLEDEDSDADEPERVLEHIDFKLSKIVYDPLHHWYTGNHPQSTYLLNALVDSWRVCRQHVDYTSSSQETVSALLTPPQMLKKVQKLALTTDIPLDRRTYSIIMQAATTDATFALHELRENVAGQRMRQRHRSRQQNDQSLECGNTENVDDLLHQIEAAPLFCEDCLELMLDRGSETPSLLPDAVAFTIAMKSWAVLAKARRSMVIQHGRRSPPDFDYDPGLPVERVQGLLSELQQLYSEQVIDTPPTTITYNTLLETLVDSWKVEHAEEVLREQMIMNPEKEHVTPSLESFRLVIRGWSMVGFSAWRGRNRPDHQVRTQVFPRIDRVPIAAPQPGTARQQSPGPGQQQHAAKLSRRSGPFRME